MQPRIKKLHRRNKNVTVIVDICPTKKLGSMISCWWKTTSQSIGKAGSYHKKGSAAMQLPKYLKKELWLWKTHQAWLSTRNTTLLTQNIIFKRYLTTPHQLRFVHQISRVMLQMKSLRWFLLYALQQSRNLLKNAKLITVSNPPAKNGQKLQKEKACVSSESLYWYVATYRKVMQW